jgi:hypothetical protein
VAVPWTAVASEVLVRLPSTFATDIYPTAPGLGR